MRVARLDHVQLAMPPGGEDQAVAFYQGALGIPQVPKPPHLVARGGCWFERGQVKLHLGVDPDFRPAQKAHPALVVEDLAALIERLERSGSGVDEDPLDRRRRVYVKDPFGNRVELIEAGGPGRGPHTARSPDR